MKLEKCKCTMCTEIRELTAKKPLEARINELEEKVNKLLEILALELSSTSK